MRTFKTAMLTLSLLALPLLALPGAAEARFQVPKYSKTATVYGAQQAKNLKARVESRTQRQDSRYLRSQQATRVNKPQPAVTPKPQIQIKDSTTKAYISRSLHQQAGKNYFLKDARLQVTNVKVNNNRIAYKDGSRHVGWSAKVKQTGGSSYNAFGLVRQELKGQPRGNDRVKIQSGTPSFFVHSR